MPISKEDNDLLDSFLGTTNKQPASITPEDEALLNDFLNSDIEASPKQPLPHKEKNSVLRRVIADPAVSLAKGIVGVGETAVGLADLATGALPTIVTAGAIPLSASSKIMPVGKIGKTYEQMGGNFPATKKIIEEGYSEDQKTANKNVSDAKGFWNTVYEMIKNPSTIANTAVESAPSMLGGGAIGRQMIKGIPKLAPFIAGGIGEGATSYGQNAEQVRQQSPEGTLDPKQTAIMTASGIATGLIGVLGGKLANRLGLDNLETLLSGGNTPDILMRKKNILISMVGDAIAEGAIEELPQSAQEQIAQNLAEGKKWDEGVAEASATGLLTGMAMGGLAPALRKKTEEPKSFKLKPQTPVVQPSATVQNGNPLNLPVNEDASAYLPNVEGIEETRQEGQAQQAEQQLAEMEVIGYDENGNEIMGYPVPPKSPEVAKLESEIEGLKQTKASIVTADLQGDPAKTIPMLQKARQIDGQIAEKQSQIEEQKVVEAEQAQVPIEAPTVAPQAPIDTMTHAQRLIQAKAFAKVFAQRPPAEAPVAPVEQPVPITQEPIQPQVGEEVGKGNLPVQTSAITKTHIRGDLTGSVTYNSKDKIWEYREKGNLVDSADKPATLAKGITEMYAGYGLTWSKSKDGKFDLYTRELTEEEENSNEPKVSLEDLTKNEPYVKPTPPPKKSLLKDDPLNQIKRIGTATKGDVSVKVVVNRDGYGVETTVNGDRRYPTEEPMSLEDAQKFAVEQLGNPREAYIPETVKKETTIPVQEQGKPKLRLTDSERVGGGVQDQKDASARGLRIALLRALNEKTNAYPGENFDRLDSKQIDEVRDYMIGLQKTKDQSGKPAEMVKKSLAKPQVKEPWEMTQDEYLQERRKEVPDYKDLEPEVKQDQEDLWMDEYRSNIENSPRDANIPANVLKALSEPLLNRVIKFNEKAKKTWQDITEIWNITYPKYLDMRNKEGKFTPQSTRSIHKSAVERAIKEGKPVPASVLADYPDLKPVTKTGQETVRNESEDTVPARDKVSMVRYGKAGEILFEFDGTTYSAKEPMDVMPAEDNVGTNNEASRSWAMKQILMGNAKPVKKSLLKSPSAPAETAKKSLVKESPKVEKKSLAKAKDETVIKFNMGKRVEEAPVKVEETAKGVTVSPQLKSLLQKTFAYAGDVYDLAGDRNRPLRKQLIEMISGKKTLAKDTGVTLLRDLLFEISGADKIGGTLNSREEHLFNWIHDKQPQVKSTVNKGNPEVLRRWRLQQFQQKNPIEQKLINDGIEIKKPADEGMVELWEKLPYKLKGRNGKGMSVDLVHQHLELEGIKNLPDAENLIEVLANPIGISKKAPTMEQEQNAYWENLQAKADAFHGGKDSEVIKSSQIGEKSTFTIMGEKFTVKDIDDDNMVLRDGHTINVPLNGDIDIRIDKGSLTNPVKQDTSFDFGANVKAKPEAGTAEAFDAFQKEADSDFNLVPEYQKVKTFEEQEAERKQKAIEAQKKSQEDLPLEQPPKKSLLKGKNDGQELGNDVSVRRPEAEPVDKDKISLAKPDKQIQKANTKIQTIESLASTFTKDMANSGKVVVVNGIADLPQFAEQIKDKLSQGFTAEAFYDAESGTTYLLSDNIEKPTQDSVNKLLAHEILVHRGLEQALGKDYDKMLTHIYDKYKVFKAWTDLEKQVLAEQSGLKGDKVAIADEVLAKIKGLKNGLPAQKSLYEKIIATLTEFINRHFNTKFGKSEIEDILEQAERAVRNGTETLKAMSIPNVDKPASERYGLTKKGVPNDSPEMQTLKGELRKRYGNNYPIQDMREVLLSGREAGFMERMADTFGTRIIYFDSTTEEGRQTLHEGFYTSLVRGTVFLNTDTPVPFLQTFGHELTHRIELEHPELYQDFLKIWAKENPNFMEYYIKRRGDALARGERPETREQAISEFSADLSADAFIDPKFWDALHKKNPTLFETAKQIVLDMFDKVKGIFRVKHGSYAQIQDDFEKVNNAMVEMFSKFTDKQPNKIRMSAKPNDEAYLKAVKDGDMETAQRMVDEEARKKGYIAEGWHSGSVGNQFDTDKIGSLRASNFGEGFYFANHEAHAGLYGKAKKYYLKINNPFNFNSSNGAVLSESQSERLIKQGYDAIIAEPSNKKASEIVVFSPSQIKSADPVTYDDNGNVIPLSDRFNEKSKDIRFSAKPESRLANNPAIPAMDAIARLNIAELLSQMPQPATKGNAEVFARAEKRIRDNPKLEIERAITNKLSLNEEDVAVNKRLVDMLFTNDDSDPNIAWLAKEVAVNYFENMGTEQGRALQIRRDEAMSPAERERNYLEMMRRLPDPEFMAKLKKAKNLDERRKIMLEAVEGDTWAKIKKRLSAKGYPTNFTAMTEAQLLNPELMGAIKNVIVTSKAGTGDKIFEFYRNALISAIPSLSVNLVSTAANVTRTYGWQAAMEGAFGDIMSKMGLYEGQEKQSTGELKYQKKHFMEGVRLGKKNMRLTFLTEIPTLGGQVMDSRHIEMPNVSIEGYDIPIPFTESIVRPDGTIGRKTFNTGSSIRLPQRANSAFDEFNKGVGYVQEKVRLAYRRGITNGIKDGSPEMDKFISDVVYDKAGKEGREISERALHSVRETAFQELNGAMKDITEGLLKWREAAYIGWIFKLNLPFIVTPAAIFTMGLRRTPAGALMMAGRALQGQYKNNPELLIRHMSEQAVAFGTLVALYALIKGDGGDEEDEPIITGSREVRRRGKREMEYRTYPAQSIRIGGKYYSYGRIDPFATAFTPVVDALEMVKNGKNTDSNIRQIQTTLMALVKDKTMLQGIDNIIETAQSPNKINDYVAKQTSAFMPNIVRSTMRSFDPYIRDNSAKSMSDIPKAVMRNALPLPQIAGMPKVDIWGRDVAKTEQLWGGETSDIVWRIVVPIKVQTANDIVNYDRLLINYNARLADAKDEWWPTMPVMRTLKIYGKEYELTEAQRHEYLKLRGEYALQFLKNTRLNFNDPQERDIKIRMKKAFESAGDRAKFKIVQGGNLKQIQYGGKISLAKGEE